jgi:L-asparaginase
MLVGEGALLFAKEMGYATQNILSPEAEQDYVSWRQKNKFQKVKDLFPPDSQRGSHGTVITLAANGHGSFAGGVSTSGWDYKYPGRLGDSPIIGAGLYVDSSYGAAACTHCGENAIRTCLARSVVAYLKCGRPLEDAVREGMHDLSRLKGGIQGQVVLYAIDAAGNFLVAQRFREPIGEYYVFTEGMDKPERRQAICFSN